MAYKIQKGQVEGLREALLELAEDISQTGVDLAATINSAISSLTSLINSTGSYLETELNDVNNTLTANLALTGLSVQNQINLLPDQVDYDLLDSRLDDHDTEIDLISGRVNHLSGVVSGLKDFEQDVLSSSLASMPLTGSGEAIVANGFKHRVEDEFSISGGGNVLINSDDFVYISGRQGVNIDSGDESSPTDISISSRDDVNITASGEVLIALPTGQIFLQNIGNGGEINGYNWNKISLDFTGDGALILSNETVSWYSETNEYGKQGTIAHSIGSFTVTTEANDGYTTSFEIDDGLHFNSNTGSIVLSSLGGISSFDVQVGNGGINIDSLGGDVDFITQSGNMIIKSLQSNNPLKGDMTIFAGKALDLESHSGDITIDADMFLQMYSDSGIVINTNPGAGAYLTIINLPGTNPGGSNRVWNNGGVLQIT